MNALIRWVLIAIGALVVAIVAGIVTFIVSFLAGEGTLHYDAHKPGCYHGRQFYGDPIVVYSIGKLDWKVHQYGCPKSDQFDPNDYKRL